MTAYSVAEAKNTLPKLIDRALQGEEVVITRHDRPVARLVPVGAHRIEDVRRAVQGLRDLQEETRASGVELSDGEVRAAIEEGRM
ncbi:MAG TPA: type II toxin-antitoxin system prevent-host-death family antitoxin [Thermoanaerobaculia bacterium]|nr:type II toxin-antitoxin system prevent-host-death family antitoxin [Thermoanaerobaculia bacterium]